MESKCLYFFTHLAYLRKQGIGFIDWDFERSTVPSNLVFAPLANHRQQA